MRRSLVLVLAGALAGTAGCDGGGTCTMPSCMMKKDPPQVFLTAEESTVIAPTLKFRVNVTGCEKVSGIEIKNDKKSLITVNDVQKLPHAFELPASVFVPMFQTLGLAVNLTLKARAQCDDGRENTSNGKSIQFFPVEFVKPPATGNSTALPDAFIAEGGGGGVPNTFIGCVGTADGTALARFNVNGEVIGANISLPFPCTYNSTISEKDPGSGLRWLIEPGVGVFSFKSNPNDPMDILAVQKGVLPNLGVGPDGDALVWDSKAFAANNFFRVSKSGNAQSPPIWATQVQGIMCSDPVVSQNEVRVIMWQSMVGQYNGTMTVLKFNYTNGAFLGQTDLANIEYGEFNKIVIPPAQFNKSGTLVYFAFQNNGAMRKTSQIAACASDSTLGCTGGGGSSWVSPLFPTVVTAAVPFANGSLIAAIAGNATYFLNAQTGALVNNFAYPIMPSGNLETLAVQRGNGTDFYLMNGREGGYPTEIIAVDSPQQGELWRVQIEGGNVPLAAMNLAVDEGNNPWMRVGPNMVKPSPNSVYRNQKGMNLEPDAGM